VVCGFRSESRSSWAAVRIYVFMAMNGAKRLADVGLWHKAGMPTMLSDVLGGKADIRKCSGNVC